MDEFGSISFAPTADQAQDALRRGQLEGIPQAIKVLSLRLPRVLGARAPAPPDLLNAPGAQGADPFLGEVIKTLARTLTPMGIPAGFGGGETPGTPQVIPGAGPTPAPRPIFQDVPGKPGGTAGPPPPPAPKPRPPQRPWYKDVPTQGRMI
jgi:hypothetical protein